MKKLTSEDIRKISREIASSKKYEKRACGVAGLSRRLDKDEEGSSPDSKHNQKSLAADHDVSPKAVKNLKDEAPRDSLPYENYDPDNPEDCMEQLSDEMFKD